jgi:superfamily II DNA or RNA helicase
MELGSLQQSVDSAFKKVQDPLKARAGKVLAKVPGGKVLQRGANLLIDNPETLPMQAVPIPGLTPGWLAAKKGAEKLIDHMAPMKTADVKTPLLPHQQRVVDRIQQKDQPGLVVVHGLGSGKTLTSIAAQEALKMPSDIVAPAALLQNYQKERKKHLTGRSQSAHMLSMQNMASKGIAPTRPLMVVDEAHRARDPSTATFQTLRDNTAQKRLLLTGSPFYNNPADIAPLVNLAADAKVLPYEREDFARRYITEKVVKPSLLQRGANIFRSDENKVRPGTVPMLYDKMAPELRGHLAKWVDYHPGSTEGFPEVSREDVNVPMSHKQMRVYDTLMDKAPAWVSAKVKRGLPPNKQEAQQLNAFLSGARQASNTTAPFLGEGREQDVQDPKIQAAFEHMQRMLKENPRGKGVVYSNYLHAGIDPYKQRLTQAGIPFGEFTGEMPKKKREQLVRDYNENKIRALLLSSAGGEGLDLKGTRLMQVLEPHWNEEKLKQVEGRGARFQSHTDLPKEEQKMLIERYLATRPQGILSRAAQKVIGRAPDKSTDEYLAQMSANKEKLIEQFRALLPKEKPEEKAAAASPTTPESKSIATSWKPLLAAEASTALPAAYWGSRIGGLIGMVVGAKQHEPTHQSVEAFSDAGTMVGGVLGASLGHLIAKTQNDMLLQSGKQLAREAVRKPGKENVLRERASAVSKAEVAKSFGRGLIGPGYLAARMAAARAPKSLMLNVFGPVLPLNALGALGHGYSEKYRNQIGLHELENQRLLESTKDEERLRRLRRQVGALENKVEGDGWKKRDKEDEPEDSGWKKRPVKTKTGASGLNLDKWWSEVGGPHLSRGGSHLKFNYLMHKAGIPPKVRAQFMRSAKRQYPGGSLTGQAKKHAPGLLRKGRYAVPALALAGLYAHETHKKKEGASAPTRGGFMMASDLPSFRAPRLDQAIQKNSGSVTPPDNSTKDNPELLNTSKYAESKNCPSCGAKGTVKTAEELVPCSTCSACGAFSKQAGFYKLEGDAVIETDKDGKSLGKGPLPERKGHVVLRKEKDGDGLGIYAPYSSSDFKRSKYAVSHEWVQGAVQKARTTRPRLQEFAAKAREAAEALPAGAHQDKRLVAHATSHYRHLDTARFLPGEAEDLMKKGPRTAEHPLVKERSLRSYLRSSSDQAQSKRMKGNTHAKSKFAMSLEEFDVFVQKLKEAGLTPASQLSKTQSIGAPKATPPPGPSIAQIAKPRGARFGVGIPGAFKSRIGGDAGVSLG